MRLETPRLTLRRPQGADLPAYRAYCQSDRTRFTGGPYSAVQAFDKLAAMIGHWDIRGFGRLVFCDRSTGRPLGHVGALHLDDESAPEMTWTIWSGADEGQGLATEAADAYLCHARHNLPFAALLARIMPGNTASRRLAVRLGAIQDKDASSPAWMPDALTFVFRLND